MASVAPLPHRFRVEEYHRMASAGLFGEDDRVELLGGEIIDMAPIGSRHAAAVDRLNRLLVTRLGEAPIVRVQSPIRLDDMSEPRPDVTVLRPRPDFYSGDHPQPGAILLVVEVSDTSVAWDRRVKIPLYADAGVVEVWVVDLVEEAVEVFRSPGAGGYAEVSRAGRGGTLTVVGTDVGVGEILG